MYRRSSEPGPQLVEYSPVTTLMCSAGAVAMAGVVLALGCQTQIPLAGSVTSAAQGSTTVYLKADFDAGESPFTATDSSQVTLVADRELALSGRSLQIGRARDGRYIGATTALQVQGAKDLRIAFVARATAMQTVAVNVFDRRRQDNTTPASPARIFDEEWHSVVFAAEDFHYNSKPRDEKIDLATDFVSLLFHGQEDSPAAELWVDKVVVYRGPDDQPPAAPAGLKGAASADGAVELTWREAADNTFAVVYSVHRRADGGAWEKVGETLRPRYLDHPRTAAGYAYRITAADFENNMSPPSLDVTVTTATARSAAAAPSIQAADRQTYAENVRGIHARGYSRRRPDAFLFAGDSLTAATAYTHVLGSWLGRGLTVRQGVGTVTMEYGAANIKDYLAGARPEFAVVMYGTNDVERVPVPQSMRNMAAIIDACVEAGTIPIVATIPPRGYDPRDQRGPEQFNRALIDLARQKRVPVSYVFEEAMRHPLESILYDGLHLHPESGNDAAGRALRQTMDQVYFALRDAGSAR